VPEKASRKLIMKDGSALAGPGLRGTPFRALTLHRRDRRVRQRPDG